MDMDCGVCGATTLRCSPVILFENVVYHEKCWEQKKETGNKK